MKTQAIRLSHLVAALAACALAMPTPSLRADVPDAFLDYVEATGTQMVDTGCLIGSNYTIVAEYAYPDPIVGQNNYLFGVYKQGMTAGFFYSNSGSYPLRFQKANGTSGATTTEAGINATPNAKQTVTMRIGSEKISSIVSESGETLYSGNLGGTIRQDATAPLALFTVNISGSPSSSYTSAAKIYHLRIYDDKGVIVCNLLPCRKDNRAALYDKIADKILFATGGDLVAGPVLPRPVEFVKWLQSDGADGDRQLYIDTGVPGKAGTGMTAELLWPAKPSAASTVCGAMADSTHHFTLYTSAGTHQIGYANYSAFQVNTGTSVVYPDKRYRVTSSLAKSAQNLQVEDLDGTGYNGSRFFNDANLIDASHVLYLFARNDAGTPNQFSRVRLYSLMLTNEVGVIRDFIPCVADNGKAGLYDRVSERVFFPQAAAGGATAEFDLNSEVGAITNRTVSFAWPAACPEYIEANGTNDYVDLGITARDGIRMVAEMEWNYLPAAGTFCGAATNATRGLFTTYRVTSDFHRMGYYNGSSTLGGANCAPVVGVRYRVETSLNSGEQVITVAKRENGAWSPVGQGTRSADLSFPAGYADLGLPLYLFACNLNGTPDEFAPVRIYQIKLWQKDGQGNYVLVRDIRPAYYPGDNEPALFDRLNDAWYFNNGGYRLSAGGATKPFVGRGTIIFIE